MFVRSVFQPVKLEGDRNNVDNNNDDGNNENSKDVRVQIKAHQWHSVNDTMISIQSLPSEAHSYIYSNDKWKAPRTMNNNIHYNRHVYNLHPPHNWIK